MKYLFILFIVMPIAEITLLIKVGQQIGVLPTVLIVVMTAVIGSLMLRQQGLSTLMRAQQRLQTGELPLQEMLEGIVLAVGGALLITPGLISDVFGFLCLFPVSRKGLVRFAQRHIKLRSAATMNMTMGASGRSYNEGPEKYQGSENSSAHEKNGAIEGEYQREDEPNKKN